MKRPPPDMRIKKVWTNLSDLDVRRAWRRSRSGSFLNDAEKHSFSAHRAAQPNLNLAP